MTRPFKGLRGRRPLFTLGIALNTAVISMVVSGLGATPAAAANLKTETVWIPLDCNIGSQFGGPEQHLAVALKVTHPKHVAPAANFRLSGVTAVQVLPPLAQQTAAAVFHANATEGVVFDFEQNLTNAKGNFTPGGTGTQVNTVAAQQPPNKDAPPVGTATVSQTSPRDPLIDPNTANPSPLAAWNGGVSSGGPYPAVPASSSKRHDEFSFGPIPISSTATANSYGPSPGTGGGPLVTSGTPDPLIVRPFTVTGANGQNVVFNVGDASRTVTHSSGNPPGPLVAIAGAFYFRPDISKWVAADTAGDPFPIYCAPDTSTGKVAKPDPTMVDNITIPIVCTDGEDCGPYGNASVIRQLSIVGTDAGLIGTAGAILVVLSTLVLVAIRRRRAGRL